MFPQQGPTTLRDELYEHPMDKVNTYEELITRRLNLNHDILVERVAFLAEARLRRKADPQKVEHFPNNPAESQHMSITKICNLRAANVKQTLVYVRGLEAMLAACKDGTFEAAYLSDEFSQELVDLTPSPVEMSGKDEGKDGGKEATPAGKK